MFSFIQCDATLYLALFVFFIFASNKHSPDLLICQRPLPAHVSIGLYPNDTAEQVGKLNLALRKKEI